MTTIRRNWTKRVAEIRTAARTCRAYDSDSGNMLPVDPAGAFEVWEHTPRARLTEDTPGQKWTIHVHSNQFYVLTAKETAALADDAPDAESPAVPPTAPPGPRHTCQGASPAMAQDHGAARALAHRRVATRAPGRDRLPAHVPAMAAEERATEPPTGPTATATATATGDSSPGEPQEHRPGSPRTGRAHSDSVLSRIDAVLHGGAVTDDPAVGTDAMRSVPLAARDDIIHAYTRAQALTDGTLIAADTELAREAGFRVPVALTSAVWEGCVAWNEDDSERQVPQDERGRLWDVLFMSRAAIRASSGSSDRVTVNLRRVPRDGRTRHAQPVRLVCAIGPGDQGEPVITVMEPHED